VKVILGNMVKDDANFSFEKGKVTLDGVCVSIALDVLFVTVIDDFMTAGEFSPNTLVGGPFVSPDAGVTVDVLSDSGFEGLSIGALD